MDVRTFAAEMRGEIFRLVKMAALGLCAALALAAVSAFTAHPVATFFRIVSIIGSCLVVVSAAMMILTFRSARTIKPAALTVTLVVTGVSTLLSLWLGGVRAQPAALVAAFGGGCLIGAGWSLTSLLYGLADEVKARGTAWHLLVWALTFAFNQIGALALGQAPWAASLMMMTGAGLTIGNTATMLARVLQLQHSRALPATPATGVG